MLGKDMPDAVAMAVEQGFEPEDCTQVVFCWPGRPDLAPSLWFGQWQDPEATYWIVTPRSATKHQGPVR